VIEDGQPLMPQIPNIIFPLPVFVQVKVLVAAGVGVGVGVPSSATAELNIHRLTIKVIKKVLMKPPKLYLLRELKSTAKSESKPI